MANYYQNISTIRSAMSYRLREIKREIVLLEIESRELKEKIEPLEMKRFIDLYNASKASE